MENERIYLSPPHMGTQELEFVQQAFESNWIAPIGPHLNAFEKELAAYNDIEHCAALSSGTAAIHLALIILGVKQGDDVICSSFTFSGSCNPVLYQQATPVFVDSESDSMNMDPGLFREAIEARIKKTGNTPKAAIVVHLYGMPAKITEIMKIAREYEIPVIEDAAEALGSEYEGKKLGTFGDFGIFSFNGNKIITTSGGGALVSRNEGWIQQARFLATQARDPAPHYEHSQVGYNYRLSNVSAAIGRGQMRVLADRVGQRRRVFATYRQRLEPLGLFSFMNELPGAVSNRWLTTVILTQQYPHDREFLRKKLEESNVEARPLWKPMHLQPVFKGYPAFISGVSERFFNNGLCLPSGSSLTDEQIDRVIRIIQVTGRAITA